MSALLCLKAIRAEASRFKHYLDHVRVPAPELPVCPLATANSAGSVGTKERGGPEESNQSLAEASAEL